jgi:preprotein translocase SecE subunit
MKKVTWPGKNEVVGTTGVVIAATIVFALFLWACDEAFGRSVLWLLQRFGARA